MNKDEFIKSIESMSVTELNDLVKALEENGIGRPSTYASILAAIQDREYVEKKENRFYTNLE